MTTFVGVWGFSRDRRQLCIDANWFSFLFRRTELLLVARCACKDMRGDKEQAGNQGCEGMRTQPQHFSACGRLNPALSSPPWPSPKICWATWASLWPLCADTELLQPNPRDVRSPLLPFSAHQESCERVNIPSLLAARLNRGNRIPAPSPGVFHPCQHLLLMLCLAYCIY